MDIQPLKVSENKRFLVKQDGSPFFWLGDTAWELFHKLNREEADEYLLNRAEKRFTVIQAVVLAEFDGLRTGNAYGRLPLLKNESGGYDPTAWDLTGDYSYWDHVDYIVDRAASLGLYIGMLPTWGDKYNQKWGKGPEIFDVDNAREYGWLLGSRYRDKDNIIWILGGDRPLEIDEHLRIVRAMAEGLQAGDEGRHLLTFHPPGGRSSSAFVHEEEWLDFNMIQSGHGLEGRDNYKKVQDDYEREPVKPVLDGEPCYEDHPRGFDAKNGYFDAADVRQAAYWAVFAGGFGHTYGHHSVWSMTTEPADYFIMTWKQALDRPGASQMRFLRRLLESRPFLERVPDQSLIAKQYPGYNHLQATRGRGYAYIYTPAGLPIQVTMGKISGEKVRGFWYDPRTGLQYYAGHYENTGVVKFIPPTQGRGEDWVLVLDDATSNFPPPGQL